MNAPPTGSGRGEEVRIDSAGESVHEAGLAAVREADFAARIRDRRSPPPPPEPWSWQAPQPLPVHYEHRSDTLGIAFAVQRLPFAALQVLDPRLVRIPPGASNELHRHAHESLFVVLEGEAEIQIGDRHLLLGRGGIAHVPRWMVHQSHNPSADQELLLLAITDFGLTSQVLGDYDRQTRLRYGGADAFGAAP